MNKIIKKILTVIACSALSVSLVFAGCSSMAEKYVVSIEKTSSTQTEEVFTVTYSDGTTSEFSVSAGLRGEDGIDGKDGTAGLRGEDGKDLNIDDIYSRYVEEYGDISYAEFLRLYLSLNTDVNNVIGKNMLSVAKVYTEFVETKTYMIGFGRYQQVSEVALSAGSAVIWSVDESAEGYTYLVTNYHVVYDQSADTTKNGGNIAKNINIYLYGSEGAPTEMTGKDENGYTQYDYGDYAVKCEYVGGSIEADIAVLKTPTSTIKAVNENIEPVTISDNYYVGQTAIAIGNPEDGGISVTRGIVSVENDYIALKIDNTTRYYRSIRIDTALYSGNSGGGLFDIDGKLIGITNAGDSEDQNINFAVPLEIVKGTVENILYYYDGTQPASVKKIVLGIEVKTQNSAYIYDEVKGCGKICEEVVISSITNGSIAESLCLAEGDIIKSISIDESEYEIERTFNISDILLNVREGDSITVKYVRGGNESTTQTYEVTTSDLSIIS